MNLTFRMLVNILNNFSKNNLTVILLKCMLTSIRNVKFMKMHVFKMYTAVCVIFLIKCVCV